MVRINHLCIYFPDPKIYMEEFTLSELGVFLGVVGGIMNSVLLIFQKSKCANMTHYYMTHLKGARTFYGSRSRRTNKSG